MQAKLHRQTSHDSAVDAATARHGNGDESLLPVLQDVQADAGFLSLNAIAATSDALNLSDAQTFGVASFYSMLDTHPCPKNIIRVCDGPVCMACGGQRARVALEQSADRGEWKIERSSCLGLCDYAPAALVNDEACGPIAEENAEQVLAGWRGDALYYSEPLPTERRVLLQRVGKVDAMSIDSATGMGAYTVLSQALKRSPDSVITEVEKSELRGRGGAGFPAGRKLRFVSEAEGDPKFVICNADESEPMAFKDRVLTENDPHLLLEGMALAAYAVGAQHGVIYIRGEYHQPFQMLEQAIRQATDAGRLGTNIDGSGFSFHVDVHRGAGAYICGEETALLESLEGRRGEPRVRPPYPTTAGYRGKPTLVNNVETLCSLPSILEHGGDWYRSLAIGAGAGTKLFTITGHVNRPGVFEAPLGITLRNIIDDFGGGMRPDSQFKMALAGGAAGTIVGNSSLDTPLGFDSHEKGITLGSGGFLILDQSVSVITLLGWLLHFFEVESCGKCTPCREGTREARLIVDRIAGGKVNPIDIDQLKRLARMLDATSLCGLGQSVSWPIESALANFGAEFDCA